VRGVVGLLRFLRTFGRPSEHEFIGSSPTSTDVGVLFCPIFYDVLYLVVYHVFGKVKMITYSKIWS
jgi:hypothetical protein